MLGCSVSHCPSGRTKSETGAHTRGGFRPTPRSGNSFNGCAGLRAQFGAIVYTSCNNARRGRQVGADVELFSICNARIQIDIQTETLRGGGDVTTSREVEPLARERTIAAAFCAASSMPVDAVAQLLAWYRAEVLDAYKACLRGRQ